MSRAAEHKVKMVLDVWCGGPTWSDGVWEAACGALGYGTKGTWGYGAGKVYNVLTGAEIVNSGNTFHFHSGHIVHPNNLCMIGFSTATGFMDGPGKKAFGVTRQSNTDRFVWEGVQIGTSATYNYFYRESAA